MRVLVGCECSQVVTKAFLDVGCDAWSCDIQDSYGSIPDRHIKDDIKYVYKHFKPDLFICHPPCTYLSHAGLCRLVPSGVLDPVRYELGLQARSFFSWCLSRPAKMICIENPIPIKRFGLPRPSQYIEPWYFGHPYSKTTCLWLRGLPSLVQTFPVRPVMSWTDFTRSQRKRSETFSGVAEAMADQWGRGELVGLQYTFF